MIVRERMSEREDHLSKASAFVTKRTRVGKAARNKGVESRGTRSSPSSSRGRIRVYKCQEHVSPPGCSSTTLKMSSKLLLDTLALQARPDNGILLIITIVCESNVNPPFSVCRSIKRRKKKGVTIISSVTNLILSCHFNTRYWKKIIPLSSVIRVDKFSRLLSRKFSSEVGLGKKK